MSYKGSCHCGRVAFKVDGTLDQVFECNCSHCSRKGYLLWFVPPSQFTLLGSPEGLGEYTFNQHVIRYHFCTTCGCAPFGLGTLRSGKQAALINVRCLEDVETAALTRIPIDGRAF